MATLTTVEGYLYDCLGEILEEGVLSLALQSDMVSVDGTKVAPFTIEIDLSEMSPLGAISVSLYATVGASPAGLAYFVAFDPDPTDTTLPARMKPGYFENYWSVPNTQSVVPLGNFVSALRGTPSSNYLPVDGAAVALAGTARTTAGASANYIELPINGVLRRIQIYATT